VKQARSYTLAEIASLLELRLVGDDDCLIHGLSTLAAARPGQISFLSNPAYSKQLATCRKTPM
jgi:UDP-3-O-[3-hydroxymyristoyl] glucosamine N-acyltransferase